jgi:hypothetical protein
VSSVDKPVTLSTIVRCHVSDACTNSLILLGGADALRLARQLL